MNIKELLDQLLHSGQQIAKKGLQHAEHGLGVPKSGPERERALSSLGKGAAVGGLLALLVGTRTGRRLGGSLLKIGGVAALGALGYSAFRKWQSGQSGNLDVGSPISKLDGDQAEQRSIKLVRAMIAAAMSDGHIDEHEQMGITARVSELDIPEEQREILKQEVNKPSDVRQIAAMADSQSAAIEIYIASLAVIDAQNEAERKYLDDLASALKLPAELVEQLENETVEA